MDFSHICSTTGSNTETLSRQDKGILHKEPVFIHKSNNIPCIPVYIKFSQILITLYVVHRASGGPVDAGPEYKKAFSEELNKLQRLYGSGDLTEFPEFKFSGGYII